MNDSLDAVVSACSKTVGEKVKYACIRSKSSVDLDCELLVEELSRDF